MRGAACLFFLLLVFNPLARSEKAPDFSAKDIQGRSYSLRKYSGKPVVLYFWATWCRPCRKEVKKMAEIYQTYSAKGVHFLSVSLDTDLKDLKSFVEEKKIAYPVLYDGKGWNNELSELYGIQSTPSFVLLDRNQEITVKGHWTRELAEHLQDVS